MNKKLDFFDAEPEKYNQPTTNTKSRDRERFCVSLPKSFIRSFKSWAILRGLKLGEIIETALTDYRHGYDKNFENLEDEEDPIMKRNQEVAIDLIRAGYKIDMIQKISKLDLQMVKSLELKIQKEKF